MSRRRTGASEDFNELVTVTIVAGDGERVEVSGTGFGPRTVPHLVSVYGQTFNIEVDAPLRLLPLLATSRA